MEPKCSVDVAGSVLDAEDSFGSVTLRRFESPLTRLVHIQILFLQSAFSFFFLFLVTKMALKPNSHIFFFSLELSRGEQNICWSFFFFFYLFVTPLVRFLPTSCFAASALEIGNLGKKENADCNENMARSWHFPNATKNLFVFVFGPIRDLPSRPVLARSEGKSPGFGMQMANKTDRGSNSPLLYPK